MSKRFPSQATETHPDTLTKDSTGDWVRRSATLERPKQYEYKGVMLEEKATVEHHHDPGIVGLMVTAMFNEGWEFVQVYVVPEPKHYGVYGLFRREKKET